MQLNAPGAPAPQIDMETLRASARAMDLEKLSSKSALKTQTDEPPDNSAVNNNPLPAPIPQQQHHQSAFQVAAMVQSSGEPSPQQISPSASAGPTPQSPWSSNAAMNGRYQPADPVQHQSFMRTSQASPR